MPTRPITAASSELVAEWLNDASSTEPEALDALLGGADAGLERCLRQQHSATIVDLHFGAGLAFLLSWQRFARLRHEGGAQRLHYVAIVPHPCSVAQLEALHQHWPQLAAWAEPLRAAWPLLLPGTHRLALEHGAVTLTLVFGGLDAELHRLEAGADLFYLHAQETRFDAAAAGWNPHQCKRLARLAWTGAQALAWQGDQALADTMRQVGFVGQAMPHVFDYAPAWKRPPAHVASSDTPLLRQPCHARHAMVIGAGLAGCAIAERLAVRGWRIDLIDACEEPAQRASGNHGGLFMPALARDDSALARLTRAAYLYAINHWQMLGGVGLTRTDADGVVGELCGVLQLGRDARQALSFAQGAAEWDYPPEYARWLNAAQSAQLLGMPTAGGGYLFERAGWLNPPSVCRRSLVKAGLASQAGAGLQMHFGRAVASLARTCISTSDSWRAVDPQGRQIAEAPVVILAAGAQAHSLAQSADLPLQAMRGQVSHLPAGGFPQLPVALCGDGYLTRPYQGRVCIGASYDLDDETTLRAASHAENLQRLHHMLPAIAIHYTAPEADDPVLSGRVGFRSVAPDRLPLVGALPRAGSRSARLDQMQREPGLYGLLGYASRGLIWAPLMAELLAASLEREPLPLPRDLVAALDAARFAGR